MRPRRRIAQLVGGNGGTATARSRSRAVSSIERARVRDDHVSSRDPKYAARLAGLPGRRDHPRTPMRRGCLSRRSASPIRNGRVRHPRRAPPIRRSAPRPRRARDGPSSSMSATLGRGRGPSDRTRVVGDDRPSWATGGRASMPASSSNPRVPDRRPLHGPTRGWVPCARTSRIGNRVTIHAGAIVGSDGFSDTCPERPASGKIPQGRHRDHRRRTSRSAPMPPSIARRSGRRTIGARDEDRQTWSWWRTAAGIGPYCLLAAQTGPLGGDDARQRGVMLGRTGRVGRPSANIGDGRQSRRAVRGISNDLEAGGTYGGYPRRRDSPVAAILCGPGCGSERFLRRVRRPRAPGRAGRRPANEAVPFAATQAGGYTRPFPGCAHESRPRQDQGRRRTPLSLPRGRPTR